MDQAAFEEDGLRTAAGHRLHGSLQRAARVFGGGELLHAVQQARLFSDSKHFVDMPLKADPEVVLAAFGHLPDKSNRAALQEFVDAYFDAVGSELEPWTPDDFQELPEPIAKIEDAEMRDWALELNKLWSILGRKPREDVAKFQERHSSLPQRFPTIVPGGRFRETYYWDTYWIIRGLLVCDMVNTAKGIVENMLDSVRRFGFVPNGTRVYYLDRSQPPLLTDMVLAIYNVSSDKAWLAEVLPVLEAEYNFWMSAESEHSVKLVSQTGRAMVLNVYRSARRGPRPESYFEDMQTATSESAKRLARPPEEILQNICSAAESGWDFSTRWMDEGKSLQEGSKPDMATINTSQIVPVDLNCFLLRVEQGLARAHEELDLSQARYEEAAQNRIEAINEFLWCGDTNSYRDYRLDVRDLSKVHSLSDWCVPFWAGLYGRTGKEAEVMVQSLKDSGLLQAAGAASTAVFTDSSTQWDAPNAWPPLQLMLIEGLATVSAASALATELAQRWLATCYAAFTKTGFMYEKYDARRPGEGGGGGEYEPQVGFGWSNGVVLVLLSMNFTPKFDADQSLKNLDLQKSPSPRLCGIGFRSFDLERVIEYALQPKQVPGKS